MFVNVGMWLERFVIIVTSLHRDFLPSSWGMYSPTRWDFATFFGTIGLFMALTFIGAVSVAESGREQVREVFIAALGCNLAWGMVDAVIRLGFRVEGTGTACTRRRRFC